MTDTAAADEADRRGRADQPLARLVRMLDGLTMSFRLLEYQYDSVITLCPKIDIQGNGVVAAMAACWGYVDVLHRVRELAQAVPGLAGNTPDLRLFLDATELAESYRHYIQHLRGELGKREANPFPVWGSLSWVDPDDPSAGHLVMVGAEVPGTGYGWVVYDTVERHWVSRVSLTLGGAAFHFDLLQATARRFESFIVPWILERSGNRLRISDRPTHMVARFEVGPVGPEPQRFADEGVQP